MNLYKVCTECHKPKKLHRFNNDLEICKSCNRDDIKMIREAKKIKQAKDKLVTCLKCDREFRGRTNVRICGSCKDNQSYDFGIYNKTIYEAV